MITFEYSTGMRACMVQTVDELPQLPDVIDNLYADFETTSGDLYKDSINPWFHCEMLGIAFTFDDSNTAWYLPARHHWGDNLPVEAVELYWRDLLFRAKTWTNHNIKYDAHVSYNSCGVDPLDYCDLGLRLKCTVTLAKLIDSDRWSYTLDSLSNDWLPMEFRKRVDITKQWLDGSPKKKDYGVVPADQMAEYACMDVLGNRELDRHIERRLPNECRDVFNTECELTEMLINAERIGVRVDPQELKIEHAKALYRALQIEEQLHDMTGTYIRPHTNADCFDLLCNRYGLPTLGWTKSGEPSFNKDTLKLYLGLPDAPKDIIRMCLEHRQLSTFISLFAEPYQTLQRDGIMHASFNQSVRTGRMSASKPNLQQLNKKAKALIYPHDGYYFETHDYSQIEFRIIVAYINAQSAIKAYNDNPRTDFHQLVAEMCAIKRRPAKTVNFMMGYGGGKKKTVKVLSANEDIAAEIERRMEESRVPEKQRVEVHRVLTQQYAEEIYETYHALLPTLKSTSRAAERVARRRGYVRNHSGRHRHLPAKFAHKAFNSACQSSAADTMKERAVALYKATRGTGIEPIGLVHDEFLLMVPDRYWDEPEVASDIVGILESPVKPYSVPLKTSSGWARGSWLNATLEADRREEAGEHVDPTFGSLERFRTGSSNTASEQVYT